MHPEFAAMCAEFEANEGKPKAAGPATMGIFDGLFSRLRSAWKSAGLKVGDFWSWLPLILELISFLGPKISEIIAYIKDLINKGETPESVDVKAAKAAMSPV